MASQKSLKAKSNIRPQSGADRKRTAQPKGSIERKSVMTLGLAQVVKGTRVRLKERLGSLNAKSEGIVQHVWQNGKLTVKMTHTERCEGIDVLLAGVDADLFELGAKCPS